ncbi:small integral membrane protein 12 isoform X1 [Temnothorax longispinosus]|uniref:small integral membrane protein 12 isoform X1 n=2 Tax=Temnothorax TaxID=300110 RepID=UPI003A99493D
MKTKEFCKCSWLKISKTCSCVHTCNYSPLKRMWPLIVRSLGKFGKYITLPIVGIIGFIGYNVEGWISDRYTPSTKSITQQRQERLLENIDSSTTKKKHNPLEVNLSPSLSS